MTVSLFSLFIFINSLYYYTCQDFTLEKNSSNSVQLEMDSHIFKALSHIEKTYCEINSLVPEAENVVEFSAELLLQNFPEIFKEANIFVEAVSEMLSKSFRVVNDDFNFVIRVDDVVLDDIQTILQQKNYQVDELVSALFSQDVFMEQVKTGLEYGLLEHFFVDALEDNCSHEQE